MICMKFPAGRSLPHLSARISFFALKAGFFSSCLISIYKIYVLILSDINFQLPVSLRVFHCHHRAEVHLDRSSFFATATNASLVHAIPWPCLLQLAAALVLDATSQDFSEETSVAVDAFFDLHLTKPALVTLIGCSSNHARHESTRQTTSSAFHYAGAL